MSIEFRPGDYCTWENDLGNHMSGHKNWIICQVAQVTKPAGGTTIYRLKPIERQSNGMSDFWVPEGEVRTAPGFCFVCKRSVGLENNKLKPHNKGSNLCYGSYMPGLI